MKIGDKFTLGRQEFTLISTADGTAMLVDNESIGLSDPISVKNSQNITREEFEEMSSGWVLEAFDKETVLLVESEKPAKTISPKSEEKFSELWKRLVPQSGEPNNPKGKLVWSIGRLKHEWENNGNMNWDNVDFYLGMIDNLRDILVSDGLKFEGDVNESGSDFPKSFDTIRNEQIKQDLKFIGLLGMASRLNLTQSQTERVLQAIWTYQPDGDFDYESPFNRIEAAVVEWCQE